MTKAPPSIASLLASWHPRIPNPPADGVYSLRLPVSLAPPRRIGPLPQPHVIWARPNQDHYRIGVGEAWRRDIRKGGNRFAQLDAAVADLRRRWATESLDGESSPPELFCACAFDEEAEMSGAWAGMPANLLLLPQALLEVHGGEASLTLSCTASELVDPEACRARWSERANALFAACLDPTVEERQATALDRREATPDDPAWLDLVETARRAIAEKNFEKLVLAREIHYRKESRIDACAALNQLLAGYPECRILAFSEQGKSLLAATPERLISLHGGRIACDALGGTGQRAAVARGENSTTHSLLAQDPKTLHEHRLVVDHLRDVLERSTHSLEIPEQPRVMALNELEHLWTPVTGRCDGESTLLQLAAQLHPTPAVAGMPPAAASAWLRQHEPFERGWYGGPIGWLGVDGEGDLAVLLRCALLAGNDARLYAGAGIVAESDARAELAETELKLNTMRGVLEHAEPMTPSPPPCGPLSQAFLQHYQELKRKAEAALEVPPLGRYPASRLTDFANYSLRSGGKCLRGILAYVMCNERYRLSPEVATTAMRVVEYVHTASIIYDDKPSQDNAALRRGRPTLHRHANSEAAAELTGLALTLHAVETLTTLEEVESRRRLDAVAYITRTIRAICEGQLLDLYLDRAAADRESLERVSELKTGLGMEIAMMLPAILAGVVGDEQQPIRDLARHLGLTFQIRDDLLDREGDMAKTGKPTGQDIARGRASFVTVLGEETARAIMKHHYEAARSLAMEFEGARDFLINLLDFFVSRDR